jgi:hypothetical protein
MRLHRLLGKRRFPWIRLGAIGNFADPDFPAPTIAVWEESRHPWVSLPPDIPPKRVTKQGCKVSVCFFSRLEAVSHRYLDKGIVGARPRNMT